MSVDTALAGGTGLTGSYILSTLKDHASIKSIFAFSRRDFTDAASTTKLHPLIESDGTKWASMLPPQVQSSSNPFILFSALGTTRAKVGGLANQYKIDHDLPISLAKSLAQTSSSQSKTFVLISGASANPKSLSGYIKMKGETEEAVRALVKSSVVEKESLDHLIIVRPGLIVGKRAQEDSRPPEYALRRLADFMGHWSGNKLKDFWAQDAEVIGRAAVNAALQVAEGKRKDTSRVWILEQADIVRLGRTEWPGQ